jgi:UDP-glucose 4-epimerase
MPSKTESKMDFQGAFGDRRVLITGGAGFIGSALARRLVGLGAQVTVIDSLIPEYGGNLRNLAGIRERIQLNISDVRDPHSLKYLVQRQDLLFNLAGQTSHLDSMLDPYTDLDINARAQLALLEALRHHNPSVKVVFAGTRQVYGRPQYLPVDERHPLVPVDVNGINKVAGEWYHLLYQQVYGIRASVLRLTNTYGPAMRIKDARQTFLGIWIRSLIENKPFQVFGEGSQVRDYNYVEDVVDAFLLAAALPQAEGEIFNLGAPDYLSLMETAKLLTSLWGGGSFEVVPFPRERKSIDIGDYYGDFRKIETCLGWRPRVPLAEGLRSTLNYFQENIKHYL